MAQLADKVHQVERLKAEKDITNECHKKEKGGYTYAYEYASNMGDDCFKEGEVNVAELKKTPLCL